MLRLLFLWIALAFALSLNAAPIKLDTMKVADRTYTNVTITSFSTTDVYFSHSKGVASAKIRNLESSVQKLLDYNPTTAQKAEQQQAQSEKRYEGNLAAAVAAQPRVKPGSAETEEHFADPVSDKSLLGKKGPGVEVEKWLTDKPDFEGKFILISFWSTRSQASRKWIPQFNALQKKFKTKLQVVAISSEPETDVAASGDPKIEFASGIDSRARLLSLVGLTSVPSVVLMDPKGTVLYYGHPAALNEAQLQAVLAKPVD